MQNAMQTSQMPLFEMHRDAPDPLNILSLQKPRTAPAATSHDDVRAPIREALRPAEGQHPYSVLIQTDIATVLPKRPRSPKALWRIMERLSASALSNFTVSITTSSTQWDVVAIQDGDDHDLEDGEFFQARLSASGLVDAFMAFANEILETQDTFGRLYLLPPHRAARDSGHGCDCCVGPHRMMVAYLTEGEVDLLDAEGISVDLL